MKSLADALVYAVVYINTRMNDDEGDADVGALESIAAFLSAATDAEKDQLAEAATRALAAEKKSASPRPQFIRDYSNWMENMIGGDEWQNNVRV